MNDCGYRFVPVALFRPPAPNRRHALVEGLAVLEVREPQLIVSSGGGECRTCLEAGLQEALNPLSVGPLSKSAAAKDIKGTLLLPAVSRDLHFPPSILFFSGAWVMRISLMCGGLQENFIMLHYP
jgi:hypothetical protein